MIKLDAFEVASLGGMEFPSFRDIKSRNEEWRATVAISIPNDDLDRIADGYFGVRREPATTQTDGTFSNGSQDPMSAVLLQEAIRKSYEAKEVAMNAKVTDPLSVACPVCSSLRGTKCIDGRGVLIDYHHARYIKAAEQARTREIGTWKTTVPVSETASNPIDVDCRKCGASAGHDCIDAVTSALMKECSHTIRHHDANEASGRLIAEKPTPAVGQVWKHPHQTGQLRIVGRNGDDTSWRAEREPGFWDAGEEWFLTDEWFQKAELVSEPETPAPAVGQVWKGNHDGACEVELKFSECGYFIAWQVTDGRITHWTKPACPGTIRWLAEGWFKNATLVREAKSGAEKRTVYSRDDVSLTIDGHDIVPLWPEKITFIDGSDVKLTVQTPGPMTTINAHCAWCGTVTEGQLGDRPFCCNVHKSEYENNPGGSWLAEHSKAVARSVQQGIEKTLNLPPKETVTVAGITMDRARYEERCRAYDGYANGKLGRYVADVNAGSWISKMTRMPSTLEHSSFNNPDDPESDHPWSCDDADYVVMG